VTLAFVALQESPVGTNRTYQAGPAMSSVDGSRVARAKLTQWHWSGAVFCPACRCSRFRLLALMESANKVPFCCAGYGALDIGWVVPVPGLTGLPSHRIALATS
jgi:hypothetical protein